jgi:hypothetical protein
VNKQLIESIFKRKDPFEIKPPIDADWSYPHTNMDPSVFSYIATKYLLPNTVDNKLTFYLEVGSFKAGSIIRIANTLKEKYSHWKDVSIVCVDPFTGDVNMWAWQNQPKGRGNRRRHQFLDTGLDGKPRIMDRFRANVIDKNHQDMIIDFKATGLVGMKIIKRLYNETRISELPQMIYLDSAHEEHESFLELNVAWSLLPECGIIFGDDWSWDAVQLDVIKFAKSLNLPSLEVAEAEPALEKGVNTATREQPVPGVILAQRGQWFMQKPKSNGACLVNVAGRWV